MTANSTPTTLRARYLFPIAGPPIENGTIVIQDGLIVAVGGSGNGRESDAQDLGNVAIVPGLVNAHTHLEFSDLPAPLAQPGAPITEWIRELIAQRRQQSEVDRLAAIVRGAHECLASGTTTIGEIATSDWRQPLKGRLPPVTIRMFRELIAPQRQRVDEALSLAQAFVTQPASPHILPGLSPHAPYTIQSSLLGGLVRLSQQFQLPLAMHLAESREELELLESGSGPFRQMLADLNSWDSEPGARLLSAFEYLQALAAAPRALVIHGNYLGAGEHAFLAEHASTMTLVYCPRTHAYFGHGPYPLARLLKQGVSVALGTDSRASNPDLNLWEEMRFAAEHHPSVSPAEILALGTSSGSLAMGLTDRGTLVPGKRADLAIIALGNEPIGDDPHQQLFAPGTRVVQTWIAGRRVAG